MEQDDLFERRGDDVVLEVPVTISEAALGASVASPPRAAATCRSRSRPAARTGARSACAARARPKLKGGGTATCTCGCACDVPEKLSKEQKQLFEQLAATLADPRRDGGLRGMTRGR